MARLHALLRLVVIAALAGCEGGGEDGTDAATRGSVGEACQRNLDCESAFCIPAVSGGEASAWPGGICTAPCQDDATCAGGTCVAFEDSGYCMLGCDPGAPACRDGYVCHPSLAVCLPDCRVSWECGPYFVCDEATGACALPATPGGALGAACEGGLDCVSALCLAAEDEAGAFTGWTGGMCSLPCPTGDCGEGGACLRLGDYLLCVPECAEGACRDGYVCVEALGGCLPDCRLGWDCGTGYACGEDGRCALEMAEVSAFGAPCLSDFACETGVCLPESAGWPEGTCAAFCGSAWCPETSGCVVLGGYPYCLPGCDDASPCRDGYVCTQPEGVCMPDCRGGYDCGTEYTCSSTTGFCDANPAPLSGLGATCSSDAVCDSGLCLLDVASGFTLGVCTEVCAASCPAGFGCVALEAGSWCLPTCGDGCPSAFVCESSSQLCVPSCLSGWPCPSGYVCRNTGLCRDPGPGPGPG